MRLHNDVPLRSMGETLNSRGNNAENVEKLAVSPKPWVRLAASTEDAQLPAISSGGRSGV
jgi:hypothetical protein